jgi:hypothetical protein
LQQLAISRRSGLSIRGIEDKITGLAAAMFEDAIGAPQLVSLGRTTGEMPHESLTPPAARRFGSVPERQRRRRDQRRR